MFINSIGNLKYSQRLLGGPFPQAVQWGQEVLVALCPLQVPEVLADQGVLKILQTLHHPESNKCWSQWEHTFLYNVKCDALYTPYLGAINAWCPWLTLWPWVTWSTCITL